MPAFPCAQRVKNAECNNSIFTMSVSITGNVARTAGGCISHDPILLSRYCPQWCLTHFIPRTSCAATVISISSCAYYNVEICVIFVFMDQLRERVLQENNRLQFPRSTKLLFGIRFHKYHSKSEVAMTKSPRLDIMLNNNLQKKLGEFSQDVN